MKLDEIDRDQAIIILKKLVEEHPSMLESIQQVINELDYDLNAHQIARELFVELDLLDVEDLWHK